MGSLYFEDNSNNTPKPTMSTPATPKKVSKPKKVAEHPTYKAMVAAAIAALKSRNGSSRQAIAKYIQGNFKGINNMNTHLKTALKSMVAKGDIAITKGTGAAGSYKLVKKPVEKKPKK